MKKLKKKNS